MTLSWACTPPQPQEIRQDHIEPLSSSADINYSTGQKIYVPAYSQIYSMYTSSNETITNLSVTLSIRNTDLDNSIIVRSVKFYDDDGSFIKDYISEPFKLAPMASVAYKIDKEDTSGGIGANFIVEWGAEEEVHEPYIEAIMIGAQASLGFAWRSTGYVLKEPTQ